MISRFLTAPITKTVRATPQDPQRGRVYKMEREFVGCAIYHSVGRKNLDMVMRHACAYYRVPNPKLELYSDSKSRVFGETCHNSVIRLNKGFHGANLATLLHELAHYVTDTLCGEHQAHGPQFCAIYMHLLDKYRILPSVAFRALAKKWRVKIARRFRPDALRA